MGRLRKALAVIMGHDPVVALESFLANKDKLQLSVPICAYPAQCTRGCKPHGAETYFIEDVRDPEEVELYVASSLKSDLSVHPPQSISWVADFSLESKSHLFSIGELIDVLQVSSLVLSPRRRKKKSDVKRNAGVPSVPLSNFTLDRFALHSMSSEETSADTGGFVTPRGSFPSLEMRPLSPLALAKSLSEGKGKGHYNFLLLKAHQIACPLCTHLCAPQQTSVVTEGSMISRRLALGVSLAYFY